MAIAASSVRPAAPAPVATAAAAAAPSPLHRLLDETLPLPAEFGGGMANHLPMALQALDALGADEARMRAFTSHYRRHFGADDLAAAKRDVEAATAQAGESSAMLASDWTAALGRVDLQEALRAHFTAALAREGRDALLRRVLPHLLPGVAAQAFHGPIRVAHAVESGHAGELALALAYWAARATPLPAPEPVPASTFDRIEPWLQALDDAWRRDDVPPLERLPFIQARLVQAAGTRAYRALAAGLDAAPGDPLPLLQQLALAGARRYARTRNLTMLHVVTATRAVMVLSRWLPPGTPGTLAPLWHAAAAGSLAATLQAPAQRERVAPLRWVDILARARASLDDHVVKLVHALWTIESTREDPDGAWAGTVAVQG